MSGRKIPPIKHAQTYVCLTHAQMNGQPENIMPTALSAGRLKHKNTDVIALVSI